MISLIWKEVKRLIMVEETSVEDGRNYTRAQNIIKERISFKIGSTYNSQLITRSIFGLPVK